MSSLSHSVGLSKLNFHNFRHNFRDTVNYLRPPNDVVEDTEQFQLLCHSHDGPRSDLLNSVNAILLPHGFSSLSNEVFLKFILYRMSQKKVTDLIRASAKNSNPVYRK